MINARLTAVLVLVFVALSASDLHATDLVAKKIVFRTLPRVGMPTQIGCEVSNTNVLPAIQFYVRFLIRFGAQTVYQQQVESADLVPNATTTVWSEIPFTPMVGGMYDASAEVLFAEEIDPSDNTTQTTFTPRPPYISIPEAVARLDADVLNALPEKNSLNAFLVRPLDDPTDSVHAEGTTVTLRDGSISELPYPSYLFFVDLFPLYFWGHPALAVRIPAERGSTAQTHVTNTDHPFLLNGVEPSFGPGCGPNPDRVRGNPTGCTPPPNYSTITTPNDADWAIVFTGRVLEDVDDNTMRHDLKKVVDRLNSGAYGPRITGANVRVRRGDGDKGVTKQQLCDELDSLKGKACRKLIIKYIGHGVPEGLVLKKAGANETEVLSWDDFANKIKDIGSGEVCVDITACYSGKAVGALRRAGVRGTVVTSSDSTRTTPQGVGSGTYWEEALRECSADSSADLDRDGMVHLKEAALWVKARKPANDPALGPRPEIVCLNDSVKSVVSGIDTRTDRSWEIPTPGGSLVTTVERFCVRTSFKRETGRRDTTVWRNNIYITNRSGSDRNANKTFEFVTKCGRGRAAKDSVILTISPQVGPKATICVGVIPEGCDGLSVREVRGPRRMPFIAGADSGQVVDHRSATIVTDPGDYFRVEHTFVDVGQDARYTASTEGPAGWDVGQDPASFSSRADSVAMVDVWGWIPKDSTNGGDLLTTVTDDTSFARTMLATRVLSPLTLSGNAPIPSSHHRNVIVTSGTSALRALEHAMVDLSATAGVSAAVTGLYLNDVVIESRTQSAPPLVIDAGSGPAPFLSNVVVSGIPAVTITHRDITAHNVVVGSAPVTLNTTSGSHTIAFLSSFGATGHGVTVAFAPGTTSVDLYGLGVVEPDSLDLMVRGLGQVRCTDCFIDIDNTDVADGSSIAMLQHVSAVVTDANGDPVSGATVNVLSKDDATLATGSTNADGIVVFEPVLIASRSDVVTDHTPISVQIVHQNGSYQQRSLIEHTGWAQVFMTDSTATSVDEDAVAMRSLVAPMPLARDVPAYVRDARGIESVTIVSLQGTAIMDIPAQGVTSLAIPTADLAPGWYVCVIRRTDGVDRLPIIIR